MMQRRPETASMPHASALWRCINSLDELTASPWSAYLAAVYGTTVLGEIELPFCPERLHGSAFGSCTSREQRSISLRQAFQPFRP